MSNLATFLWFERQAREAAEFYIATFLAAGRQAGFAEGGARPAPQARSVAFTLDRQSLIAFNGGPHYALTPAVSMFVQCEDQAEVDFFWNALLEGGQPSRCGWLIDRFGLSWQVIPTALGRMLGDPDRVAAGRAMQAMMTMGKLDIAELTRAFEGR